MRKNAGHGVITIAKNYSTFCSGELKLIKTHENRYLDQIFWFEKENIQNSKVRLDINFK